MKLVFRKGFERQIKSIYDYIVDKEGIERAAKILASIRQTIGRIEKYPDSFAIYRKERSMSDFKHVAIVGRTYIIIFRKYKEHIAILKIYHGKRNII